MAVQMLQEGQELDGFRIGARLHVGGMAALFEATHPAHDFPLLVKVPRLAEGEDPAAIVSFEMEQMILPRLTGPHVPRFAGAGGFDRQPYLAMERIAGPSLLPLIEALPLPIERIAEIGAKVADALDSLHRQHVVHLDVKPSNILTRPGGEAVLVDFGLSRHALLPDLMEEEFRLPYGTAPYMAPEQVMGIRSEPRSDLFALGAMLYFFTTGERPFGDPQRLSGLKRRIWRDPQPPRRLRKDCPDWLQEVILRCLEVQPERRHPTAAQLAFDLRHPGQVALTARARKERRDGWARTIQRRFHPDHQPRFARTRAEMEDAGAAAPIVIAAVDLSEPDAALQAALRGTVGRILATLPEARLACLNVLRQNRIALDMTLDEQGNNKHLQRLVELKHWAAPLGLPEGRATFHVLEAVNPAAAILDHARANRVDHIVMGARAQSLKRRVLGSVSAEVAAEAPCSVTVVRSRVEGE
ncbi:serine/threonine protein kinase [Falsiroseomonas bella]|uniref:Serine/threonine protein kinase n=1 Tax=Falsiroseomonas bella TaxID=2184016 RepID=A0A317FB53_9PROT|nr:bifunctional serine/threonine-protein kinase/universal stress protein [Falsiroseomonas bella]PWS34826.1 serine/threonine protein kinase [Falsiroseomonas bella]